MQQRFKSCLCEQKTLELSSRGCWTVLDKNTPKCISKQNYDCRETVRSFNQLCGQEGASDQLSGPIQPVVVIRRLHHIDHLFDLIHLTQTLSDQC